MMLGFGGYIVFGELHHHLHQQVEGLTCEIGLIIGCGYDRIIGVVPVLVVL